MNKPERRKHKHWCSKHQCVHNQYELAGNKVGYWSCSFPNNKELNDERRKNRKDPRSWED